MINCDDVFGQQHVILEVLLLWCALLSSSIGCSYLVVLSHISSTILLLNTAVCFSSLLVYISMLMSLAVNGQLHLLFCMHRASQHIIRHRVAVSRNELCSAV